MVALLVRLKLTLFARNFRRSPWIAVGTCLALLYGLAVVVPLTAGLVFLRTQPVDVVGPITVVGFAAVTLAWLVFPVSVAGMDETLDPARFAILPVPARRLLPGMLAASFVGPTGIAFVILGLGLVVAWSSTPATLAAALVAVPLGLATCVLLARCVTTVLGGLLASRRRRELIGAIVGLVMLGLWVLVQATMSRLSTLVHPEGWGVREEVGTFAGWLPFGWAWAVPADVGAARYGAAAAHLVLALALAAGLVRIWSSTLTGALTRPPGGVGASGQVAGGDLAERVFGRSPAGVVAGRIVRTWRRDGRFVVQLLSGLLMPAVIVMPQVLGPQGDRLGLVAAGPAAAFFFTMNLMSGLIMDGTALWVHVATGVSGAADRWGRVMAHTVVYGPLCALITGATLVLDGRVDLVVPVFAVVVTVFFGGAGLAMFLTSRIQWPAPTPDRNGNPFAQNTGGGGPAIILMLAMLGGVALLASPVLVLFILAATGQSWAAWASLPAGVVLGPGALWFGVRLGGAYLDDHWPDVLQKLKKN